MGWEAGAKGRPAPRQVDLGAAMDPRRLAEAAVQLNLRLMRWRAAPALDLARLTGTKCLLLGAGTPLCSRRLRVRCKGLGSSKLHALLSRAPAHLGAISS